MPTTRTFKFRFPIGAKVRNAQSGQMELVECVLAHAIKISGCKKDVERVVDNRQRTIEIRCTCDNKTIVFKLSSCGLNEFLVD